MPIETAINLACEEVNKEIREDAGSNRDHGNEIQKYWSQTSWSEGYGSAYCIAFVIWCYRTAGLPICRHASCTKMVTWAMNGGTPELRAEFIEQEEMAQPGDVIIIDTAQAAGAFNHGGMVESVDGKVVTTLEGNTTPDGGGMQGVYRRTRHMGTNTISGYVRVIPA